MKKSFVLVLLAMILAFAGCQESAPANTPGTTNAPEGTEKEQPVEGEDSTEAPDITKDTEPTATPEPKEVEPKLYDRLAAWDEFYKEYSCYYSAIQIEDMFLYPGMLGSELAEVVAAGKDSVITPVSADKLMEPYVEEWNEETQKVTYYRNEVPWFDVYVRNYTDDLLPYSDCIVTLIMPSEEAMEYCRFFDGTYSLNSIKEISYKDYDGFVASLENTGYTIEKDGSLWRVKSADKFCPASLSEKVLYWTQHDTLWELQVNSDTGYVSEMNPWLRSIGYSQCQLYTAPIPEDYDWSNPKFAEQMLEQFCYGNVEENAELVSLYKEEREGRFVGVVRTKNALGTTYKIKSRYNIGMDYNGNLTELNPRPDVYDSRLGIIDDTTYYVATLGTLNREFRDITLLYEYDKNLIKEIKWVNSFADMTSEYVQKFIDMGAYEAGQKMSNVQLTYVTFGNADKESGDIEHNAIWLAYKGTYQNKERYVHLGYYMPRIDLERELVVFSDWFCTNRYDDYEYMKKDCVLTGTPEENPYVTELLPYSFYEELSDKYGYVLDKNSVEQS